MKIAICDDITEYRLSIKAFANEYFKIHKRPEDYNSSGLCLLITLFLSD